MNAIHVEALVYALQITSFFLIAGPVMVKTERHRTLSSNPAWLASQPDFFTRHGAVNLRPFRLVTVALLTLLATAAATSSRAWVFAVHTPLFLLVCGGLYAYYDTTEKRLRTAIPEDPIRKASLSPRTLRSFISGWTVWGLVSAAAIILGLNAWGYATGRIDPSRALGNGMLLCLLAVALGFLVRYTLQRAPYRMSAETDSTGRSMELSLTLGTAAFFVVVCLYHSLGSWGETPLFPYPPTQLHALFEGAPWSWSHYFERSEYRWIELGTALFIALVGPWLARSSFTRKLLAADPSKVSSAFEV